MARKKKATANAVRILHSRYIKGDKKRLASIERQREKSGIAEQIYNLRTQAGLTQKQLAEMVGTTQSVISRLEDADYDGYSLKMLQKIAAAVNCRLALQFVADDCAYA